MALVVAMAVVVAVVVVEAMTEVVLGHTSSLSRQTSNPRSGRAATGGGRNGHSDVQGLQPHRGSEGTGGNV